MHPELLGTLIDAMYDAALDPSGWPRAMHLVTDTLGGNCSSVLLSNMDTGALTFEAHDLRLPDEARIDYLQHYLDADTIRQSGARGPVGVPQTERDFLGPHTREVYNDFYVRWDWCHILGMYILREQPLAATLSVYRDGRGAEFSEGELGLAAGIGRHLARAVQIQQRLASVGGERDMMSDAMELLAVGVLFVDNRGRVLLMNRAAREMTANCDGLSINGGELAGLTSAVTAQIRALISSARRRAVEVTSSVAIRRPSGRRPYVLLSWPASRSVEKPSRVMVLVTDTDREVPQALDTLRAIYSLSPAEAALAIALCQGDTVKEIAFARGVSVNTIHTQVESIQRKVGAHRQTEVVSVLLRGPLGLLRRESRDQ
jgi:DNA-binding CsgD family transcriptional regulator